MTVMLTGPVELLAGLESGSLAVTTAVLVKLLSSGVDDGTATTIVTVVVALAARLPRLQVTVPPDAVQVGPAGVDDTNVTPAGRVSVRVTPVAAEGPALLTWIVYVRFVPATAGDGDAVLVTDRSM